jgi:hypothetical protein
MDNFHRVEFEKSTTFEIFPSFRENENTKNKKQNTKYKKQKTKKIIFSCPALNHISTLLYIFIFLIEWPLKKYHIDT